MLADERVELGEQLLVTAERELGVVTKLERLEPLLVDRRRPASDGLLREVGERLSRKEGGGGAEIARGRSCIPRVERATSALDELLEAFKIKLARLEAKPVAVPVCFDAIAPERLAQSVHVDLQRRGRGLRSRIAPDRIDQLVTADKRAASEQELGKYSALLGCTQRERAAVGNGRQSTEDAKLDRDPLRQACDKAILSRAADNRRRSGPGR